jgi:membrane-associated phospholipid phosphatase
MILHYSVVVIPAITFIMYIRTKKQIYLTFLYGYILLGCILNLCLKKIFKNQQRPNTHQQCNIVSLGEDNRNGFPSGHAQAWSLTATFWTLVILTSKQTNRFGIILLWLLTYFVAVSRLNNKCHTKLQVQAGLVVGCVAGIVLFIFKNLGS